MSKLPCSLEKNGDYSKIEEKVRKMYEREMEFSQSRTSFQIEKFIGLDEHTPVTRYRHLAHNSYALLTSLKKDLIHKERVSRKLKKAQDRIQFKIDHPQMSVDFDDDADLDLKLIELNMELEDIELAINGKMKELTIFERLLDELEQQNGGPFSYSQLEYEQPEYWEKRLRSQMEESKIGASSGLGAGNFAAYKKAIAVPILKDGQNLIRPFVHAQNQIEQKEV
ncbi:MAG TPA: hypothetical protein PLA71_00490 [Saccharofermentans sp.]|nr:hypothetical protein [Saccharofermentans sp.]